MSSGYWRLLSALGRCLIICAALAVGVGAQSVDDDASAQKGPKQDKKALAPNPQPIFPPAVQDSIERAVRALEAANNDPNAATERQRAQDDLEAQQWMALWAGAMFFIAFASTIITGVGVFLIYRTLVYTRDTLKAANATLVEAENTTKAAQDSVTEAKNATAQAKATADSTLATMKDSTQRELRAYLSMTPRDVSSVREGAIMVVTLYPKNYGQTPAYNVRHVFELEVLPEPLPDNFKHPEPTRNLATDFTVFPNTDDNKTWFRGRNPLTAEQVAALASGRAFVHVWGVTHYRDAFKVPRTVRFFARIGGPVLVAAQKALDQNPKYEGPFPSWTWGEGHNHGD